VREADKLLSILLHRDFSRFIIYPMALAAGQVV